MATDGEDLPERLRTPLPRLGRQRCPHPGDLALEERAARGRWQALERRQGAGR